MKEEQIILAERFKRKDTSTREYEEFKSIDAYEKEPINKENDDEHQSIENESFNKQPTCHNCIKYEKVLDNAVTSLENVLQNLKKFQNRESSTKTKENIKVCAAYERTSGCIEIEKNTGIFIDAVNFADANRFYDRPSEMIRRLMLALVGEFNLQKDKVNIVKQNCRNAKNTKKKAINQSNLEIYNKKSIFDVSEEDNRDTDEKIEEKEKESPRSLMPILECVLQILHGAGETLFYGWPLVLGIIGAVSDHHGENLVRVAFQCLQLVITDFLPVMPWRCLPLCVDTAAKFGSQTQELNISLTAVGQMWNISDYFYQNQEKICASLRGDSASVFPDFPGTTNMPAFDKLWMCLYARLGDLCIDPRPAVRKSASQTLFSTISAHGSLLNQPTWQAVLWQVLFPLLDKVRSLSSSASNEKVDTSGNILIHHSRNTAQKQWAETQVLTLSGVARVFNTKRQLLQSLGDFPRAWSLLLEFIENSALSKNNEVSLAALKSFQEILYLPKSTEITDPTQFEDSEALWIVAWRIWLSIGLESTAPPQETEIEPYIPSQAFLTALVQIFPAVYQHVKNKFSATDLQNLCLVLKNAVAIPVHSESTPFVLPTVPDVVLTQLQDGVLHSMELLQKESLSTPENLKSMISPIFIQLLYFSKLACEAPTYGKISTKHISQVRGISSENCGFKSLAIILPHFCHSSSHDLPTKFLPQFGQHFISTREGTEGL
ncbi:protein MON2 homolog [Copidosoma floridanum]|uniref:protein MON2 homolog n=1 Tax=Copidosoma floridanum TaxID=29053 RepID=UPI000C6F75FC|nr:protein MON2 homolog [Copidosoma floridanum]